MKENKNVHSTAPAKRIPQLDPYKINFTYPDPYLLIWNLDYWARKIRQVNFVIDLKTRNDILVSVGL